MTRTPYIRSISGKFFFSKQSSTTRTQVEGLMRLKLFFCLSMVIMPAFATKALAAPLFPSILAVDVDLQRGPAGVTGPTQAGFQSWHIVADADPFDGAYDPATDWNTNGGVPTGLSKTFGSFTANLGGATYNAAARAD